MGYYRKNIFTTSDTKEKWMIYNPTIYKKGKDIVFIKGKENTFVKKLKK